MDIPIIVICYNNHQYVKNTLDQIKRINPDYYRNVVIMNNCSTSEDTWRFLQSVDVPVINRPYNCHPGIDTGRNIDLYHRLPDKFILTDPDLEFNPNLPNNFIEILSELSDKYGHFKTGFALDISDFDKMFPGPYTLGRTIEDWESQFWLESNKIPDDKYELYIADIDTTFALINKKNVGKHNMRVAGNFLAKHLPWYVNNKLFTPQENYEFYKNQTEISSIKPLVMNYYHSNGI